MNASSSGVALLAAKMMSPSFSRSASSTTMTGRPSAMSLIARVTSSSGMAASSASRFCMFSSSSKVCVGVRSVIGYLRSSFSTYFAITSTSRLTSSPGCLAPSVVRLSVSGMRLTSNQSSSMAETVRLMPSTVMEPLWTTYRARSAGRLMRTTSQSAGRRGSDRPGAVGVALDEVAAEAVLEADRALQVDRDAGAEGLEAGVAEGLAHDVGGEAAGWGAVGRAVGGPFRRSDRLRSGRRR